MVREWPLCTYSIEYVMTEAPNNDRAIQSRQKQPDIPQDCVASQGAIWALHCLFLLSSSRVTYMSYDMCIKPP